MAEDPWAAFRATPPGQAAPQDPWAEFRAAPPAERGTVDKLLGQTGERYQTWPEKLARGIGSAVVSGATLPGDTLKEATQPPPATISDSDVSTAGVGRVLDAATLGMPINPAIRAGDRAVPGALKTLAPAKPPAPPAETLRSTGAQQIEQSRNMGVDLSPDSVRNLGASIETHLQNEYGFNDKLAEKTFGILRELNTPPDEAVAVTFGNLQTLRRSLGEAAGSPDGSERKAAVAAIRKLDEWMSAVPEGSLLAGPTSTPENAAKAAALYQRGRGNYAAAERSDDITGRAEAADLRASATNSGQNIGNATRQRFVDILTKDSAGRGYSQEELGAVERLVRGTQPMNKARYVGNLLGGGGGLGQNVTAAGGAAFGALGGSTVGGPVGAGFGAVLGATVPASVGALARALHNRLATGAADKVDDLVRQRSPLYQEMQAAAPMQAQGLAKREALIRLLMEGREPAAR